MTFRVLLASRRGTAHATRGTERQDRAAAVNLGGDWFLAVADGVGSCARGADAAQVAVDTAQASLTSLLQIDTGDTAVRAAEVTVDAPRGLDPATAEIVHHALVGSLFAARAAVMEAAREASSDLREWGTTLSVALIRSGFVHVAQIGDGYAVLDRGDGSAPVLLGNRTGVEDDPSIVTPLTSNRIAHELSYAWAPFEHGSTFLLTTDGIAPILLDKWIPPTVSPRFMSAIVRQVRDRDWTSEALARFLDSDPVCDRTDDDKSVVIAHSYQSAGKHLLGPPSSDVGQESVRALDAPAPTVAELVAQGRAAQINEPSLSSDTTPDPSNALDEDGARIGDAPAPNDSLEPGTAGDLEPVEWHDAEAETAGIADAPQPGPAGRFKPRSFRRPR